MANLLFAPENLTRSGLETPEGVSLHAGWYKLQMFVDGRWIEVPSEQIQYRALLGDTGETGGGHWCGAAFEPSLGSLYITRCAILPPKSAFAPYTDPPQ